MCEINKANTVKCEQLVNFGERYMGTHGITFSTFFCFKEFRKQNLRMRSIVD